MLQMEEFNHQVELTDGVLEEECSALLSDFFKEIKEKHSENYYVHLVTREKAKEMKKKWREKYCTNEQPTLTLEELDHHLNKIYEKHAFYL